MSVYKYLFFVLFSEWKLGGMGELGVVLCELWGGAPEKI